MVSRPSLATSARQKIVATARPAELLEVEPQVLLTIQTNEAPLSLKAAGLIVRDAGRARDCAAVGKIDAVPAPLVRERAPARGRGCRDGEHGRVPAQDDLACGLLSNARLLGEARVADAQDAQRAGGHLRSNVAGGGAGDLNVK